jgi:hypothetical protein
MFDLLVTKVFAQERTLTVLPGLNKNEVNDSLIEKLQSGNIHLSDLPLFIASFIEAAIVFAGIVSFLMILVGGYQYIIGGVYSDMRENGKNTLIYAISGFVLALLSYAIVTIVQLAATAI